MSSTDTSREDPFPATEETEASAYEPAAASYRDEPLADDGYGKANEQMPQGTDRRMVRAQGLLAKLFGDRLYGQSALQYLIGLKATFLSLDRPTNAKGELIWREMDRILAKYPGNARILDDQAAWDDANRCERLLVNLYDPTRLDVELDRRILEAQQMKLDFASFYSGRQMKATADKTLTDEQENVNRSLLSRLIQDQQWHDNKLYLKRSYAHTAQMRVSIAFLLALVLFGITMISVFGSAGKLAVTEAQSGPAESSAAVAAQPEATP